MGGLKCVDAKTLSDMLRIGGGSELKFVFISSCFSSRTAAAFVEAGYVTVCECVVALPSAMRLPLDLRDGARLPFLLLL